MSPQRDQSRIVPEGTSRHDSGKQLAEVRIRLASVSGFELRWEKSTKLSAGALYRASAGFRDISAQEKTIPQKTELPAPNSKTPNIAVPSKR